MEPQIQYAISADGTRIACYKIGQGPPLLDVESLPSHLLVAWQSEFLRRSAERLSQNYTLIKFDRRGSGLSQRGRVSHEMDAQVADIVAVLDRFAVERTSILARGIGAASAIAFAAEHPERVDKLVLWSGFAAAHKLQSGQLTGTVALLQHDYATYTETIASGVLGWASGNAAREYADAPRAGQTQEEAIASMQADVSIDVRNRLSSIQAPTLVVHVKDSQFPGVQAASELAASIPKAQLAMIEGDTPAGTLTHEGGRRWPIVVEAFLSRNAALDAPTLEPPAAIVAATTAIILFTDIADSTALTEHMGDTAFRAASRTLDAALRAAMRDCGGTPVDGKVLGDGVMGVFASAAQAIEAARRCVELSGESELRLHIGVHAGDVIREESNVYGGAVNIASRICGLCEPGEILVSGTIRDLARTSAGATFEDRGEHLLKGIDDPVRVFAVRGE